MTSMMSGRRAAGFTLLELIVVVLIFGVMSVMAYGGLRSVLDDREALERALERTAAFQKAYVRMRGDFQNLRQRPIRDEYGDLQPAFVAGDEGGVEFTRGGWRNPLYLPRSSLERVAYQLVDGELRRLSWRELDRAAGAEPLVVTLLDNVEALRWRYLERSLEWQEQWPPAGQGDADAADVDPPLAVEVTLETPDWGELRLLFRPGLPREDIAASALPGAAADLGATGDEGDATAPDGNTDGGGEDGGDSGDDAQDEGDFFEDEVRDPDTMRLGQERPGS